MYIQKYQGAIEENGFINHYVVHEITIFGHSCWFEDHYRKEDDIFRKRVGDIPRMIYKFYLLLKGYMNNLSVESFGKLLFSQYSLDDIKKEFEKSYQIIDDFKGE